MYFDRRLWELTRGLRGSIVFAILLGLVASVVGIARFAILGVLLSHVFNGAGLLAIAIPAIGVAAAVVLRGVVDHHRAMISHRTATRVQRSGRLGLPASAPAASCCRSSTASSNFRPFSANTCRS
jgi:ATP-binding cassette, subfamily B, bacterial